MQHFFSIGLLAALFTFSAASAQVPTWQGGAQTLNPTPTDDTDAAGQAVAVDAAGNAVVAGSFDAGSVSAAPAVRDFGATRLRMPAGHVHSGFVARLLSSQQWQWAVPVTAPGPGPSVDHVDQNLGETLIAGTVRGSATVSVGSLSGAVSATSLNNLFVSRLPPAPRNG